MNGARREPGLALTFITRSRRDHDQINHFAESAQQKMPHAHEYDVVANVESFRPDAEYGQWLVLLRHRSSQVF